MGKKIVFILNGIYKSRCIKRIEEFIDNGYDVDVYGFSWDNGLENKSEKFVINVIGNQSNRFSYLKRLWIIIKSVYPLIRKYKNQDIWFYYFFIDVAIGSSFLSKAPYLYEESDIPYLNMHNKLVKFLMRLLDRRIIRKSLLTIMTSEGFIKYHFGSNAPGNIVLIPNRLNSRIIDYPFTPRMFNKDCLSIGFVGGVRYKSILSFAEVFVSHYPLYHFHVFGDIERPFEDWCQMLLQRYDNLHFHGIFHNPEDLSSIYEQIDLVLATYDISSENVRYAEPNKLYESIYFNTPIIVSEGTFLSDKVERLGVGYSIDPLDEQSIIDFVDSLSEKDVLRKKNAEKQIPISYVINRNPELFEILRAKN